MANTLKALGSNQISVTQLTPGTPYILNIVFNNSYDESSDKIFIGGIPLTLASDNSGIYFLRVIVDSGADLTDNGFIWGETNIRVADNTDSQKIMLVNINSGADSEPTNSIMYNGMTIGLNDVNFMIMSRFIPTTVADEEASMFIGGVPLLVRRYNDNWYLVVQNS